MSETNPLIGSNPQPQAQQMQVSLRDEKAVSVYSNVSQISMGPQAEEVVLELGTMLRDNAKPEALVMEINAKVYMSLFAAKKLALQLSQGQLRLENGGRRNNLHAL